MSVVESLLVVASTQSLDAIVARVEREGRCNRPTPEEAAHADAIARFFDALTAREDVL